MNNRYPQLCDSVKCTACSACANICRHGAITMTENSHGELHPIIDIDKCIMCGLCEKVCPENNISHAVKKYGKPEIYYCWLKSKEDRKQSTSGGAGFAIASAIIAKGGHVWGAAYDDNMEVCYIEANTVEELRKIQKSKYVQSKFGDSFSKIKAELNNGDLVLFSGTPCHVKGLRSFLRKDYDNLLTVDLVCHGVPGHGIFRKYKRWLEEKYKDKLTFFDFRPKEKDGQERSCRCKAHFKRQGIVNIESSENGYFVGFQKNVFLRDACFSCSSKGEERYADITIADFWGLGKIKPFHDNKQRAYGISMLALNSEKAKNFLCEIQDSFIIEKRSYREAACSNTQYYECSKPSLNRDKFWEEWEMLDWASLSAKYFKISHKEKFSFLVKKYIHPTLLSKLKMIFRYIK